VTAVPDRLLASLRRLHKRQPGDRVIQYHNARKDGVERSRRPVKGIRRAFREVAKEAKLPHVTPHILKHTAVSWALRVASPWVVSGMTATSVKTLQSVYGKHMADDLKAAAEAVARSGITRKPRANPQNKKATRNGKNGRKKPMK
jgi:integrase